MSSGQNRSPEREVYTKLSLEKTANKISRSVWRRALIRSCLGSANAYFLPHSQPAMAFVIFKANDFSEVEEKGSGTESRIYRAYTERFG